jgi:hypothetical protein
MSLLKWSQRLEKSFQPGDNDNLMTPLFRVAEATEPFSYAHFHPFANRFIGQGLHFIVTVQLFSLEILFIKHVCKAEAQGADRPGCPRGVMRYRLFRIATS